ncbi:5162_t:CDS:2, partial [Acaulospora colombiana]
DPEYSRLWVIWVNSVSVLLRTYSDVQHEANKVTFEGLYHQACRDKVLKVLAVAPGETRRDLDLVHGEIYSRRYLRNILWCQDHSGFADVAAL